MGQGTTVATASVEINMKMETGVHQGLLRNF